VLRFILRHCGVLYVRLIPQDSRALHLIVFEQPARTAVYQRTDNGLEPRTGWNHPFTTCKELRHRPRTPSPLGTGVSNLNHININRLIPTIFLHSLAWALPWPIAASRNSSWRPDKSQEPEPFAMHSKFRVPPYRWERLSHWTRAVTQDPRII